MEKDKYILWSTGHLQNKEQSKEVNMMDIFRLKKEYEQRHPDREVLKIGLYQDNLLFNAPYRDIHSGVYSTALFLINKETGEEIGGVLYHTDFEGINNALAPENAFYYEEANPLL